MAPKRKRGGHDDRVEAPQEEVDLTKSVLGGMKGGWRLDGSEGVSNGLHTYTLPFGDKHIICQKYLNQGATNQDEGQQPDLVFTHGAGGGISNPATTEFAKGVATITPILCFQGTMNLQNRVKCFKTVFESEERPKALGGRSMGARAAVLTATDHADRIDKLVLVSFPLTSERGGDSREDILLNLPSSVDVLFVTGDEDKMCNLAHLLKVRRKMKARSWAIIVKGADHSMSLKDKKGVSAMRARTGAMAAEWLASRDADRTESVLRWDKGDAELRVGEWQPGPGNRQSRQGEDGDGDGDSETTGEAARPAKKRRKKGRA